MKYKDLKIVYNHSFQNFTAKTVVQTARLPIISLIVKFKADILIDTMETSF